MTPGSTKLKDLLRKPRLTDYNSWINECNSPTELYKQRWSPEYKAAKPAWLRPPEIDNWSMHDVYLEFKKCCAYKLVTRSIHYGKTPDGYIEETYGDVEIQLKHPNWIGKIGNTVANVSFENDQLVLRVIKPRSSKNQRPLVYRVDELEIAITELNETNNRPVLSFLFQPRSQTCKDYVEIMVQAAELQMTILPEELHITPVYLNSTYNVSNHVHTNVIE